MTVDKILNNFSNSDSLPWFSHYHYSVLSLLCHLLNNCSLCFEHESDKLCACAYVCLTLNPLNIRLDGNSQESLASGGCWKLLTGGLRSISTLWTFFIFKSSKEHMHNKVSLRNHKPKTVETLHSTFSTNIFCKIHKIVFKSSNSFSFRI